MPIDAEILQRLRDNNLTLTQLDLESNQIGDEGAKALAAVLEKNTTLTLLKLRNNQVSDTGAQALAAVLEENTTLTELNLWDNHIGDEGAKALAKVLERNTTLAELSLGSNSLGDELEEQINGLIERNQHYLQQLQAEACKQLKLARILLYKTTSADTEPNLYLNLPLELQEKIVRDVSSNALMTKEQQRLILDYAEAKMPPVADKLSFFKVTKCDRVMKLPEGHSKVSEPFSKKARLN